MRPDGSAEGRNASVYLIPLSSRTLRRIERPDEEGVMGCSVRMRQVLLVAGRAWMTTVGPAMAQHDMNMGGGTSAPAKPGAMTELPKYVADPIPILPVL